MKRYAYSKTQSLPMKVSQYNDGTLQDLQTDDAAYIRILQKNKNAKRKRQGNFIQKNLFTYQNFRRYFTSSNN